MEQITVYYSNHFQRIEFDPHSFDRITVGPGKKDTLSIRTLQAAFYIKKEDDQMVLVKDREIVRLEIGAVHSFTLGEVKLRLLWEDVPRVKALFYIGGEQEVLVAAKPDIQAHLQVLEDKLAKSSTSKWEIAQNGAGWVLLPQGKDLYVNGTLQTTPMSLNQGDILNWGSVQFELSADDSLTVRSNEEVKSTLPQLVEPTTQMKQNYPIYRRTPRMVYDMPEEKVQMTFPSQESENNNRGLWMMVLPPLMMLMVMVIIALIQPRGLFIVISAVMFMTTIVTSTVQYFRERKNHKKRKAKRLNVYTTYLQQKREELNTLASKQKEVLRFHYPDFEQMKYFTSHISDRIWERTLTSNDFLHLRLGIGDVPSSYQVSLSNADLSNREIDDLLEQAQQLEQHYKEVKDAPVIINLAEGAIGLIGKQSVMKDELHQLIGQLAFAHSYHDLRFVFISHEHEYKAWEWMKWLPHFMLPNSFAKGFIYNEQTRDQLLSTIYEWLRERELEEEKEAVFVPHFVFVVTNQLLISEHVIMEYLEGEYSHLGISVIFAAESKENLSDNIHTLVRYINEQEGDILIKEKKAVRIPFVMDEMKKETNERFARTLRSLDHQVGMTNSIPASVSYLDLFKATDTAELQIDRRWLTSESAKSLSVPIGLKGKEDLVELNLHEKAHGPHGLLAGTTGSGKSEFLQTYILSLAVHFHPHEVAFLLIDYKGGGMAQPFKNMPHLLGTITNIEGSKNFSARALASIKSELKRRQRLFDQHTVSHINEYTKLYKQGDAEIPMPHLFLISDEFAELKTEKPEFIRELVSAARIGRSLGVHLILATQKPGGIIDDQIWSNARFRIALKVQDASDSREILKNPDAANITVTGRGYLQVGNNEVYELFQSAWSGAAYQEETLANEDEVALVTDLGLVPLSSISTEEEKPSSGITEIDAIVEEIARVQKKLKIKQLPSPWLPPLPAKLVLPSDKQDALEFALVDEPELQLQTPYAYKWMDDGNIGIFGSSGYGKSTTVLTLLLGLARSLSPEELHYYVFDFGNGALLPIKQLTHTADYFQVDQPKKIDKFLRLMKKELNRRKQLLQKKEVSSIKLYNELSEEKLPLVFITIDNFDLVKEELQDIESQFTQISRDGQSLGVYLILTATRVNAVRQALLNNLKTKIIHYLMDTSEAYTIIGKLPFELESIPGRAVIKKEKSLFTQVSLPVEGESDLALFENIREEVQQINRYYEASHVPPGIPMLPSELPLSLFTEHYVEERNRGLIPIGLDEETVKPVHIDVAKGNHWLIIGSSQKGKTNVLRLLLHDLLKEKQLSIGLFDSIDRGLSRYSKEEQITYMQTKDQIEDWLTNAEGLFKERADEYAAALEGRSAVPVFTPVVLVIDGVGRFQQTINPALQDRIAGFMKQYSYLGFTVLAAGNSNEVSKGFDSLTSELKQIRQALLLMKKSDQNLFTLSFTRNEEEVLPGFGYFIKNGKEKRIQIPLFEAAERTVPE
ncbi:type VII secretion protein EssC [Jeotgalibacillus campisalis]|uniref:Cell division protein FtsK n=1 Tax=Jeotgalibacillus campisalis TaxID=220754 RepID=A0A0C2RFY8_9BACL|nr:type VII secretion protein EssC [Jeotgalibacillus campisalis]KIL49080.1 cell division protein FtsK [Jeotgalibacillus campisalis]